ncbi:MAG: YciI family protein [Actinomycetota bacterium]
MKYALQHYADESIQPDYSTPEGAAEMEQWGRFTDDLVAAGAMLGGEALLETPNATTVKIRDGATLTADGPFAETKEALGGFYLIDVADLDAAIAWAEKIPNVGYGTVEIRPVMSFDDE